MLCDYWTAFSSDIWTALRVPIYKDWRGSGSRCQFAQFRTRLILTVLAEPFAMFPALHFPLALSTTFVPLLSAWGMSVWEGLRVWLCSAPSRGLVDRAG